MQYASYYMVNIFAVCKFVYLHNIWCLVSGGSKSNDLSCHLRVHLLLHFMEHLEKLLYNAYEGCAVAMPMSPKVCTHHTKDSVQNYTI